MCGYLEWKCVNVSSHVCTDNGLVTQVASASAAMVLTWSSSHIISQVIAEATEQSATKYHELWSHYIANFLIT